jgi:hypothetical protein
MVIPFLPTLRVIQLKPCAPLSLLTKFPRIHHLSRILQAAIIALPYNFGCSVRARSPHAHVIELHKGVFLSIAGHSRVSAAARSTPPVFFLQLFSPQCSSHELKKCQFQLILFLFWLYMISVVGSTPCLNKSITLKCCQIREKVIVFCSKSIIRGPRR